MQYVKYTDVGNTAEMKKEKHPYVSPIRDMATAEKRQRVVDSALHLLRDEAGIGGFSLDAVAKVAGLTRLTVYNQFGSRRGLLEAVLDEIAGDGGLGELQKAMELQDAEDSLDRVVEIFCAFWAKDIAIGRLHDAMVTDPEFAQALTARNERRRDLLQVLVRRVSVDGSARQRRDAVDLIYALTSHSMYRMLSSGRSAGAACALIKAACRAAIAS